MKAGTEQSSRLLTISEAAARLDVSPASLRKWSNQGLVPVYLTPGRQRRYALADLDRFKRSMRQPGKKRRPKR